MIAIDTRDFCIPSDENDYDELVAFADTIAGIQTHEVILVDVLDKIRVEIETAVWEDVVVTLDGTDETRIPRLDPDDVLEIIDKYRAESEVEK